MPDVFEGEEEAKDIIMSLSKEALKYHECDHELDPCCVFCHMKLVIKAEEFGYEVSKKPDSMPDYS